MDRRRFEFEFGRGAASPVRLDDTQGQLPPPPRHHTLLAQAAAYPRLS